MRSIPPGFGWTAGCVVVPEVVAAGAIGAAVVTGAHAVSQTPPGAVAIRPSGDLRLRRY